jgi:RNA polymerase sigma-70 factor (ECF subfamily)
MTSDEGLLRGVAAGDAAAFDVLLARHHEAVHAHLARMLRDGSLADDLAQEVFLRVWTRADQWQPGGSPRAWLLQIATRLALNAIRSARRRSRRFVSRAERAEDEDDPAQPGWLVDPGATPLELAMAAEGEELFRELLEALPPEKRQVVLLVCEQQMALDDAAVVLGVPVGTVKSRLHHARARLAREWRELMEEEEERNDTPPAPP